MNSPVSKPSSSQDGVSRSFVRAVSQRLTQGLPVRRSLPGWGRVAVDRQLPFLCVYRKPAFRSDEGTDRLVTSEASYLTCSASSRQLESIRGLIREVCGTLGREFGVFLLLEVWAGRSPAAGSTEMTDKPTPRLRIVTPRRQSADAMTNAFRDALARLELRGQKVEVSVSRSMKRGPQKMPPLLVPEDEAALNCFYFGLEVAPVYRDLKSGELFPALLRDLRRALSLAMRQAFYEFATRHSTRHPEHYHSLGRRALVKATWEADRQLASVSEQFDLLLMVTPVNGEASWNQFRSSGFENRPTFEYRPIPTDPAILKRAVYRTPVERVEDAALARVLREKQTELDRQINLLQNRNTPAFLPSSIQLFGGVEDWLHDQAVEILATLSPQSREAAAGRRLTPEEFARRAREEIQFLRRQHADLNSTVEIRSDITGLMVSNGNLLVSRRSSIPGGRVEALLQHEVGTHVLTFHNGKAQRLQLLASGLAGYDELQEGLAVLAEYLVGGLSRPRVRLLAGRVVATRCLLDGASFVETFRVLSRSHGFSRETAFAVTTRVFRGGGLTKDAVYLRGLCQILDYLRDGNEIEPLLVGKIAANHVPIVRELQWRGVLHPAPMVPRYLRQPDTIERLTRLRRGATVLNLCEKKRRKR